MEIIPGMAKLRRLLSALLVLALATAWMLADAARRRVSSDHRVAQSQAVTRLLGTADMALSSSSRWLRHPSLSEPGAPFADGPAILDIDPAGAMIGPPHDVLAGGSHGIIERRRNLKSQ
jgi:hypothetical protein